MSRGVLRKLNINDVGLLQQLFSKVLLIRKENIYDTDVVYLTTACFA